MESLSYLDNLLVRLMKSCASEMDLISELAEVIHLIKTPSTLIRFQTKTELFCFGYGYRPHYNAENDHRKRSHSKTLSRVERFENDAF